MTTIEARPDRTIFAGPGQAGPEGAIRLVDGSTSSAGQDGGQDEVGVDPYRDLPADAGPQLLREVNRTAGEQWLPVVSFAGAADGLPDLRPGEGRELRQTAPQATRRLLVTTPHFIHIRELNRHSSPPRSPRGRLPRHLRRVRRGFILWLLLALAAGVLMALV